MAPVNAAAGYAPRLWLWVPLSLAHLLCVALQIGVDLPSLVGGSIAYILPVAFGSVVAWGGRALLRLPTTSRHLETVFMLVWALFLVVAFAFGENTSTAVP